MLDVSELLASASIRAYKAHSLAVPFSRARGAVAALAIVIVETQWISTSGPAFLSSGRIRRVEARDTSVIDQGPRGARE